MPAGADGVAHEEALGAECARAGRTRDPLSLVLFDIDHLRRWGVRGAVAADSAAGRVREAIAEAVMELGTATVSVGVAASPVHAPSAEDLVLATDRLLYDSTAAPTNASPSAR
ncbi:hypothetical protein [Winogradskya consettensis]|nr:hypothetical protein [Actinoplanes consettensis]